MYPRLLCGCLRNAACGPSDLTDRERLSPATERTFMPTTTQVVDMLKARADPKNLAGMARYGIAVDKRLGVPIPELRQIAKETGHNHKLALDLWRTGIQEARILASMIAAPSELSEQTMESWVGDFDSWDLCDQTCMNLFDRSPLARRKIGEWSRRKEEFVKRAAFALIACLASHDKQAPDEDFIQFLTVIKRGAADERNFVKKAVSWALRNIGKRNPRLNRAAIEVAEALRQMDSKAARLIGSNALQELRSEAVRGRLGL